MTERTEKQAAFMNSLIFRILAVQPLLRDRKAGYRTTWNRIIADKQVIARAIDADFNSGFMHTSVAASAAIETLLGAARAINA
jgi:hypothetical protein